MRVLMTADTVGGVWTYALELAAALEPYGVQVTLATMGPPPEPHQREQACRVRSLRLVESSFALEWMPDPWRDVDLAGAWLLRLAGRLRPDVVHLNGYSHAHLDFGARVVVGAHSCVLSWWRAVKGEDAPPEFSEYRRRVARGLARASVVLFPTYTALAEASAIYGPGFRGRVIENARDALRFSPDRKERFVLAAGRVWDEAKNVNKVDESAEGLPWPVYVAGPDRAPDGQRVALRHAHSLGALAPEALAYWMSRASIFVSPARYEPFGLSALEAGLSGCALVLGDIPSLREVWGDAALFVAPDDGAGLSASLRALAGDEAQRERMASLAFSRARTFDVGRQARRHLRLYAELAAGGGARSCAS